MFLITKFPQEIRGQVDVSPHPSISNHNYEVMERINLTPGLRSKKLDKYLQEWKNAKEEYDSKNKNNQPEMILNNRRKKLIFSNNHLYFPK